MKRFSVPFFIIFIFCVFSGMLKAQSMLLIKSIEYDVPIINKDLCQGSVMDETSWFKRNIESSKRWYFQQSLLNKAMNGDIKVYDSEGNEITKTDLLNIVSYLDTLILSRHYPPYNIYDTVVRKQISPSEIYSIRFREEWSYDPSSFRIKKKIISYCPMIAVEETISFQNKKKTISLNKPLFWIHCNAEATGTYAELTDYIQYNCPVKNATLSDLPQFGNLKEISADSMVLWSYIEAMVKDAYLKKTPAYFMPDFSDYYAYDIDSMLPLTTHELTDMLAECDTITITKTSPPYDVYDSVICNTIRTDDISILRFFEKWEFNPSTMEMRKDVLAVTPCLSVYNKNAEFKGIKPLMLLLFGQPIRCFKE